MSKSVNFIITPVGNLCNLSCDYCYNAQCAPSENTLSPETVFNLIDMIKEDEYIKDVKFTWHGGEPLLWSMSNYESVFEYQKTNLADKKYINIFQTNGTLIDREFIGLIKLYGLGVGVSIDGPDYEMNKRRFPNESMFNKLLENIWILKENDIEVALFFTLNRLNINKCDEILSFVEKINPYAYTLIPVMCREFEIDAESWKNILFKTDEFYNRTGIRHSYTDQLNKQRPNMCMMNGMCQAFVSLDANGNFRKTCNSSKGELIGNIIEKGAFSKVTAYMRKPLEKKENSLYSLTGKKKYIYFQGDGCIYRKDAGSNESFISGMALYLNEK